MEVKRPSRMVAVSDESEATEIVHETRASQWFSFVDAASIDDITGMMRADPTIVNVVDDSNMTALHCAAMCGQTEVCLVLIEGGAVVDATDDDGRTALHWAVTERSRDVASLLLRFHADPHMSDAHGSTPASLAAHTDLADLFA
eukprot:TRINITY_DN16086_c0_g1_i1.p1 TRINITY_DN16086_c0_g1~~TRINITY_DN16086_c0_g1_i1.p1  ORF type:complete len:144 (+),score=30.49 TRINITY_DN16086_c0_g1_i1:56-487(+)